jgi:hypothetical protein
MMTQYAELILTTLIPSVPGQSQLSLTEARGQLTPILGFPTQVQLNRRVLTAARTFTTSSDPDAFGSLLGAIALKLGLGGK